MHNTLITVHQQNYNSTYYGVRSSRSSGNIIEILKKDLPLLRND